MTISWPQELGKPLATGFQHTLQDNALSTPMEKGLPKIRLRSTINFEPISMTLFVDAGRWARLKRFYEIDTVFGTLDWRIEDPVFHGQPIGTPAGSLITTASGAPILISAHHDVVFAPGSPPRLGNNRGRWFDVSFDVLKLP